MLGQHYFKFWYFHGGAMGPGITGEGGIPKIWHVWPIQPLTGGQPD